MSGPAPCDKKCSSEHHVDPLFHMCRRVWVCCMALPHVTRNVAQKPRPSSAFRGRSGNETRPSTPGTQPVNTGPQSYLHSSMMSISTCVGYNCTIVTVSTQTGSYPVYPLAPLRLASHVCVCDWLGGEVQAARPDHGQDHTSWCGVYSRYA